MQRRGQITIFVILGIVIFFGAILIYYYYPTIRTWIGGQMSSPESYLKSCIEPELSKGVELLSKQGGYANPEGYAMYRGNKIKYLCYTSQYYRPCVVQEPFIKNRFEKELSQIMQVKAKDCVDKLMNYYREKEYDVKLDGPVNSEIKIEYKRMILNISAPMTISKKETLSFKNFEIVKPSEMYHILMVANTIVSYETAYGTVETTMFTLLYPNLKVRKMRLSNDDSKIYTVENVITKEKFSFALRSIAWPGGLGWKG